GHQVQERRALTPRNHEALEAGKLPNATHLDRLDLERSQATRVRREPTLERQDSDPRHAPHHPRVCISSPSGSFAVSIPCIASPSPRDTSATILGSRWWVVARTIAFARTAGSADLKIPEPTKTASAPSCIMSDASAGVAMPPAAKLGTGSLPL